MQQFYNYDLRFTKYDFHLLSGIYNGKSLFVNRKLLKRWQFGQIFTVLNIFYFLVFRNFRY